MPSHRSFSFIHGTHDFSPNLETSSQLKPGSQHFSARDVEEKQLWPRVEHSQGLPIFVSIRAGYSLHGSVGLSHSSCMASFGAFGKNDGIGPQSPLLYANETVFKTGKRLKLSGTGPDSILPCNRSTSKRLNTDRVSGIGPLKKLS